MPRFARQSHVIVEPITCAASLEAIEPQWWELWQNDPHATPFQSPAWLIPWWRHIGQGELLTIAVRTAEVIAGRNQLVGLFPLYVYTQPESGSRDLFPIGVATTDYLDPILAQGWEQAASRAAFEWIATQTDRWDLLDFRQLRSSSTCLATPVPEALVEERDTDETCVALTLPRTLAEFQAAAPSHVLHNLEYYRRRARKAGHLNIEPVSQATLDAAFDALVQLHSARWAARGEGGCLADPTVQMQLRSSMPELLWRQMLRSYVLRLDDRIIGVLYGLSDAPGRAARRFYYYLGGFDPEFERLSPGTLLIGHAIEESIRDGISSFDFLRGQEPYKYLWGARDERTYRRKLRPVPSRNPLPARNPTLCAPARPFDLRLRGVIRPCREDDLPTLEWFGLFLPQREVIREQFERQQRGQAIILIAEVNGIASGQLWIDLQGAPPSTGVFWALRVFPSLQGKGLGSRLITAGEAALSKRNVPFAEISVDQHNAPARQLYERLGYRVAYVTEAGQSVLRKRLSLNISSAHHADHPGQEIHDVKRDPQKREDRRAVDAGRCQQPRV